MNEHQIHELLYQALETELGGVQVYTTALRCVQNAELKEEWEEYLEQTENHVQILRSVFERIGLDPEAETPGRQVVRHIGESLVKAMEMALEGGEPSAAELVACECMVHAETKDHLNWELIGALKTRAGHEMGRAAGEAEPRLMAVKLNQDAHSVRGNQTPVGASLQELGQGRIRLEQACSNGIPS